ncbi:MAG: sialidase family protein [Bryobacteraceae bacterium]
MKTDIFEGGKGGYVTYRIPALVATKTGTLLAFCAARKDFGDWADIDIAMRRSSDGGKTWEPMSIVANADKVPADNPTPIVDHKTGAVHFLYQVNYARMYYMRSDDDGKTFSKPVDITYAVEKFRPEYAWTVIAPGPGHAIQLRNGRLVVPLWMSPDHAHRPSEVATIFSDDSGKTWQRGEILPRVLHHPSENVALEAADGRVMLNIRSEGKEHLRAISFSKDGATGWTKPAMQKDLYEPICMASLVRLSAMPKHKKNRILFANPDSSRDPEVIGKKWGNRKRENLTVRLSYDEGKSWPVAKLLEPGRSGYSDLAVGADGTIYCLYERGEASNGSFVNSNLGFARLALEWLTGGKDKFE